MPNVFVTPDWLDVNHEDVVIVDVRDEWEYREGHIPGAVNIPFDDFRDPTDETAGKLPTSEKFASLLGNVGIAPDDSIVAYDDEFGVYASRFVVTAEIFGHTFDQLYLLNGDYTAWQLDRPISTATPSTDPMDYTCERIGTDPLISPDELEAELRTDAIIVDTRDPIEYDTVHLPDAVNFQWRELVDESRRQLKPPEQCREVFADHGITLDRPIRLYCNTARRLSFVYLVLRELDHGDVAFYEDGIDGWAKYGGPVETTT